MRIFRWSSTLCVGNGASCCRVFSVNRIFWSTKDPRRKVTYTCRIVLHTPEDFNRPVTTPSLTIPHDRSLPNFNFDLHIRFSTTHKPQGDHVRALLKPAEAPKKSSSSTSRPRIVHRSPAVVRTPVTSHSFMPPAMTRTLPPVGASVFRPFQHKQTTSTPLPSQALLHRHPQPHMPSRGGLSKYQPIITRHPTPKSSAPSSLWSTFDSLVSAQPKAEERPHARTTTSGNHGLLGMVERLNRAASNNRSGSRERSNSRERNAFETVIFTLSYRCVYMIAVLIVSFCLQEASTVRPCLLVTPVHSCAPHLLFLLYLGSKRV